MNHTHDEVHEEVEAGTLKEGEFHPSAVPAFQFIKKYLREHKNPVMLLEAMASAAVTGNRTAEICGATLGRIIEGKNVSDRYVLGLAWFITEMEADKKAKAKEKRIQLLS